jgi:hypothetical protein
LSHGDPPGEAGTASKATRMNRVIIGRSTEP